MADEIVFAAGLLPSGKGKLRHVPKGASSAKFRGEPYVRTSGTLRDGTAIFRLDPNAVYVVCDRLLDPETNEHCEFDGRVLVDANRGWACPGCHGRRRAPTEADS